MVCFNDITKENDNTSIKCPGSPNVFYYCLIYFPFNKKINVLADLHSLAKCSLASTGLLCEQWNSTLGIRHSQFANTTGGSILWSAGVSRVGAECLFFFRFADSLKNGAGKHFRFFFHFFLSFSAVWKQQALHKQDRLSAFTGSTQKKANIIITAFVGVIILNHFYTNTFFL